MPKLATLTARETYIKVHLSTQLKQALQTYARSRGVSISALLRLMLTEYLKNKGAA